MARWEDIAGDHPEFAHAVQARFDKYKHKVLATLRKDGSPRVSGIEAEFRDGDVWLGMMPGSLKALDVRRDPRVAVHSGTEDPPEAPSPGTDFDAKISGRAVEMPAGEQRSGPPARVFRIDLTEVVLVSLGDTGDHLLITTWKPGSGLSSAQRY